VSLGRSIPTIEHFPIFQFMIAYRRRNHRVHMLRRRFQGSLVRSGILFAL